MRRCVSPFSSVLGGSLLLFILPYQDTVGFVLESSESIEDLYNAHFKHRSDEFMHDLMEKVNEVQDQLSVDYDYTFEVDGEIFTPQQFQDIMEIYNKKYLEWFFLSIPNDINSTSEFSFSDPSYDPANYTASARSWRNRKRARWALPKRHPRDVSTEAPPSNVTEPQEGLAEFLDEFNKNWTYAFFDMPRRGRAEGVQFRFSPPRPFASNRRPRLFSPKDNGTSANDLDAPVDFQPTGNFSNIFFGTTHTLAGDNETIIEVLKAMEKAEGLNPESIPDSNLQREMVDSDSDPYLALESDSKPFMIGFAHLYFGRKITSTPHEGNFNQETLTNARQSLFANGTIKPLDANKEHLEFVLFFGLDAPRDFQTNVTLRTTMARYLSNKLERFGLLAGTQTFEPHQYPDVFPDSIPKGINIIGVLPGRRWGTKDDEIIMLAAHWDTVPGSNGMDDNGSGVATVIEVARALTEAKCVNEYSVMFVLFDLEEVGCIGSIYFIRDYLIPHVLVAHGGAKLKGAYILDTVMNYNNTPGSQVWPEEWDRQIPGAKEGLEKDNMTGNFVAALYRSGVDSTLATVMSKHYAIKNRAELNVDRPSHLKQFSMKLSADMPPVEELAKWIDLLRSDHARFWFHNLEYPWSFPAVLLTDTGPYRGDMQSCYHQACDSFDGANKLGFADVTFLSRTAQALIDSVVELSQSECRNGPAAPPSTDEPQPSFTFSSFISSLVQILGQLGVNLGRSASQAEEA